MEDFIKSIKLRVEQLPDHDLTTSLKKEKGILNVEFDKQSLSIDYNPYLISKKEIIFELETAGIHIATSEPKQKGFKKWISNLALQNKKNLGNQRLDCCDMNH